MKAHKTADIEERLARVGASYAEMRRPDESLFNPEEDEEVADGKGSEP